MILALVIAMAVALIFFFCSRHFSIHLMSLKLLLDILVVFLAGVRGPGQLGVNFYASAWLLSSLGSMALFALIGTAAKRFAQSRDLNLEGTNE